AREITATAVNPGLLRSQRNAKRMSAIIDSTRCLDPARYRNRRRNASRLLIGEPDWRGGWRRNELLGRRHHRAARADECGRVIWRPMDWRNVVSRTGVE